MHVVFKYSFDSVKSLFKLRQSFFTIFLGPTSVMKKFIEFVRSIHLIIAYNKNK